MTRNLDSIRPDPNRLLLGRADVFLKVPYARSLLEGVQDSFARELYLEHLYRWNGFSEINPPKSGPTQFLEDFHKLTSSFLAEGGLSATISRVGINSDGRLTSGSHRAALALAAIDLGLAKTLELPLVESKFKSVDWNLSFFLRRGVHPEAIRQSLIERISRPELDHQRALIIWPRAFKHIEAIAEFLAQNEVVESPGVLISPNSRLLWNLVLLTYEQEKWASDLTSIAGKAAEVSQPGEQNMAIIFLDGVSDSRISDLKIGLRRIWGGRYQGVHSTDSRFDTLSLCTTVSSHHSLALLENLTPKSLMRALSSSYSLRSWSTRSGENPNLILFSGSQLLELLGIRKARDVDVISRGGIGKKLNEEWSDHSKYLESFGLIPNNLISDPRLNLWFLGAKMLHPKVYLEIIESRQEPKDFEAYKALRRMPWLDHESRFAPSWFSSLHELVNGAPRYVPKTGGPIWNLFLQEASSRFGQPSSITLRRQFTKNFALWRLEALVIRLLRTIPTPIRNRLKMILR